MTNRSKILLLGGLTLATVGLAVAWPKTASAAQKEPLPPSGAPAADGMLWMQRSDATLERQGEYNDWASSAGWPQITEDGILGPKTCEALTNWWHYGGGPTVPNVCGDAARRQLCTDAATYKAEWQRLERMRLAGDPFFNEEHWDAQYREWQLAKAACEAP